MPAVAYTVVATFDEAGVADEFVAWLEGGHVDQVIAAGAHSAMIVRITDPATPIRVEVRYVFSTPDQLQQYLALHAPRLRAEGLSRFPPERGVRLSRSVGRIQ